MQYILVVKHIFCTHFWYFTAATSSSSSWDL